MVILHARPAGQHSTTGVLATSIHAGRARRPGRGVRSARARREKTRRTRATARTRRRAGDAPGAAPVYQVTVAGSCCAAHQHCCYCVAATTWYMRSPVMDVAEATAPLRLLVLALILILVAVNGLENGLSRTPHRGWTTWNKFRCNVGDNVSVTPLGETLLPLNEG
eukprot:COSAG02_NODE_11518_length_1707_cov_78.026119_2_plen_165_part_01